MTPRAKYRPFTRDSQKTVRLRDAPLELVLCQVRWPEMSFLQEDQLRPLALKVGQAMAVDYPIYSEAKEVNYSITPEGVTQNVVGSVFQWVSVDQAWHVSLARRFVTLYCTHYTNYAEFGDRLRTALVSVRELLNIQVIDRVGVRYVNRIADDATIANLPNLIRPEVLGYPALPMPAGEVTIRTSANQAIYSVADALLQVRSGMIPAGETVDPAIAPLGGRSWVLDLDASVEARSMLDIDAVADRASQLSDIAYDYFKYVISEGFIDQFGGGSQ